MREGLLAKPTASQRAMAHRVLAAGPTDPARLLNARVDLVPGPDADR